jgi:tetratricopeptide (TPR) repeat protein
MKPEHFTTYLDHPERLDSESVSALEEIIREFPFCQPAQLLYLKSLQNDENIRFNRQLKITAAYASDRKILFDLLNIPKFVEPEPVVIPPDFEPEPDLARQVEHLLPIDDFDLLQFDFTVEPEEETPKPAEINISPRRSPADELIDKFIQNPQPKVLRPDQGPVNEIDVSINSLREDDEFLTETLARIYVQQGYYLKAIQAYEKLSLKIPEKSVYFASQIDMVRELIKNQ